MARREAEDGVIVIKKYANRRLYNTASSSYITLDDLSRMTRDGVDFKVLDAKTGDDITHSILTQIIMEEESSGGEIDHDHVHRYLAEQRQGGALMP